MKCELCGTEVKVMGHTTKYYVPEKELIKVVFSPDDLDIAISTVKDGRVVKITRLDPQLISQLCEIANAKIEPLLKANRELVDTAKAFQKLLAESKVMLDEAIIFAKHLRECDEFTINDYDYFDSVQEKIIRVDDWLKKYEGK